MYWCFGQKSEGRNEFGDDQSIILDNFFPPSAGIELEFLKLPLQQVPIP